VARRLTARRAAARRHRLERVTLRHVGVRLRGRWVLRDVGFDLRAGENWLLVGANGAGKTLLLRLLRGEIWPTPTGVERRCYLIGNEWHDQPLAAREHIAYLGPEQQDRYERRGWDSSVAGTVATGLFDTTIPLDVVTSAQRRAVRHALGEVGLAGLAKRRFLSLSLGQRRRVLLARALVRRPDVLLLDEVLNGLDAASRRAVLHSLRRLARAGTTWILSSHRPLHPMPPFTHVARLERGRLVSAASLSRGRGAGVAVADRVRARGTGVRRGGTSTRTGPFIVLENVTVYREGRRVLNRLDWILRWGEHWCVTGANGSGKSTLMALLYGDLAPAFGGRIVRGLHGFTGAIEDWKQQTGVVSAELQALYATTACTVQEIVVSGMHSSIGLNEPPRAGEIATARTWIARVGLQGLGQRRARELSYGQLRLALLARALVRPRRLLLLDEPFDGLDARSIRVAKHLVDSAALGRAQVILATHHEADLPPYVGHSLELRRGTARVRQPD
jgi:molybdate transport system ATP-binding protein